LQSYSVLFLFLESRRRRCRLFTLLYTPGGLTGSQTLTSFEVLLEGPLVTQVPVEGPPMSQVPGHRFRALFRVLRRDLFMTVSLCDPEILSLRQVVTGEVEDNIRRNRRILH
jgi:hypothetical protein